VPGALAPPFATAVAGYVWVVVEAGATDRGWLVEFLGGPWDRQSGLFDLEPGEVIEAPLEPHSGIDLQ
jgi:hypothetical protein